MCLIGGYLSSEVGEDRSSNLLSRTFFFVLVFYYRFVQQHRIFTLYVTVLLSYGALSESKR